jgi:hypothetical protein
VESSRNPTLRTLRSGAGSLSQPVSLGGFGSGLAEQASWNVDQRESSSLLWQFVGVGFHDYLDSFIAGVDFDPHGAVFDRSSTPSRSRWPPFCVPLSVNPSEILYVRKPVVKHIDGRSKVWPEVRGAS